MSNLTIYLVRHGKTLFNTIGKVQGWCDSPLTDEGVLVAHYVGKGLATVKFDAVYTSDASRTRATAKIITSHNNYQQNYILNELIELREMCFGKYEGESNKLMWQEVYTKCAGDVKKLPTSELINVLAALDETGMAENLENYHARLKKGLNIMLDNELGKSKTVLVVSHGMSILEMMHLLGFVPEQIERPANVSVTILEANQDRKIDLLTYASEEFAERGATL